MELAPEALQSSVDTESMIAHPTAMLNLKISKNYRYADALHISRLVVELHQVGDGSSTVVSTQRRREFSRAVVYCVSFHVKLPRPSPSQPNLVGFLLVTSPVRMSNFTNFMFPSAVRLTVITSTGSGTVYPCQ